MFNMKIKPSLLNYVNRKKLMAQTIPKPIGKMMENYAKNKEQNNKMKQKDEREDIVKLMVAWMAAAWQWSGTTKALQEELVSSFVFLSISILFLYFHAVPVYQ